MPVAIGHPFVLTGLPGEQGQGLSGGPVFGGRVAETVEIPGPSPQLLQNVHKVDRHVPAGGLGADLVELVTSAVDQHHPGPGVAGVARLGGVEHLSDHRAAQPFAAGARPGPWRPPGGAITSCGRRGAAQRRRPRQGWPSACGRVSPPRLGGCGEVGVARAAALAVSGRNASGRIPMPLLSRLSTSSVEAVHINHFPAGPRSPRLGCSPACCCPPGQAPPSIRPVSREAAPVLVRRSRRTVPRSTRSRRALRQV